MDTGRRIVDGVFTTILILGIVAMGDQFGTVILRGGAAFSQAVGALYGPALKQGQ